MVPDRNQIVAKNQQLIHIQTMQTYLVKFLLVIMTVAGIVMPVYAYAHEMSETHESHSTEFNMQHDTDNESTFCDHCCHFSSHTQGIIRIPTKIDELQKNHITNFQNKNYSSIEFPPPYHPPIA